MAWEIANADGGSFYRGLPADLKPVTIIAQALDNQWLPNSLLSRVLTERKALKDFVPVRETHVRREFLRALLNAENVVANRAYLCNNKSIADLYHARSTSREAFQSLLNSRSLVPFLLSEKSPHEQVARGTTFDRDREAFETWQEVARTSRPSCIRLAWPLADGGDNQNNELIRANLVRPFHDYGVVVKSGKAECYAQHLGIDASRVPAFRQRLNDASRWFFDAPELEDGPAFRQRNDFYKEFVVRNDSPVHEGWYDPDKPFSAELKRLIDLKYNVNLADAIGKFAFTPMDSLPRLALQESSIGVKDEGRSTNAEAVVALLRRVMTDLVQRQLSVPFLDRVELDDIVTVRAADPWKAYTRKFGDLLDIPSAWKPDAEMPLDLLNTKLQEVFENYAAMADLLAGTIRKRRHESVRSGCKIAYGLTITVLGQVIASVTPGHKILYSAMAELAKSFAPLNNTAHIVCKLFFKDPTRNDALQLEADMLQVRLPNAREELKKLLADLKKDGFSEDFRTSLLENEARINAGESEN